MDKQVKLTLEVRPQGQAAGDEPPSMAAYFLSSAGRVERKIAAVSGGKITLALDAENDSAKIVAFGPDVEDLSSLRKSGLLQFRVRDQLAVWERDKMIEIPRQWWVDWYFPRVCVSGRVRKCYPILWESLSAFRLPEISIPLPHRPFPPYPWFCRPVCDGVVEIYERDCCCRPWLLIDLADLLRRLREIILVEGPIPPIPPDPGPLAELGQTELVSRTATRSVKRAEALGTVTMLPEDRARISADIRTLEKLSRAEAIDYIEARPYLWPFWCSCSTRWLHDVTIRPDGSFHYCYHKFPLTRFGCSSTYAYKVKQWQNNQWVYIYDGVARHQYFTSDQVADLTTLLGRACGQGNGYPNDKPFVTLQDIGGTRSYDLNSHYQGQTLAGTDLTQVSDDAVAAPPATGGLANPSNANGLGLLVNQPWGADLWFRLHFDEGMKALGARYYRVSVIRGQPNGNPAAGTPNILTTAISWQKYVHVGGHVEIQGVGLGPNPVGGETGLYTIPYDSDADWLDGQFHQVWDTTAKDALNQPLWDGWCLLAVEVFNGAGNLMTPAANGFDFLRLMSSSGAGSTAKVGFAKLQHLFWVDNRPVYADIEDLRMNGLASNAECQFMSGTAGSTFSAGYRAFHATQNSGSVPETFMWYHTLWYHRGLNGPNATIQTNGENEPPTLLGGGPATSVPQTFASMLGTSNPGAKCTFALNLAAYAKHTNGSRRLSEYDRYDQAAFALEIA